MTSWTGLPTTEEPLLASGAPLYVYIPPYRLEIGDHPKHFPGRFPRYAYASLETRLAKQTEWPELKLTRTPSERDPFCVIRLDERPRPVAKDIHELLTILTFWLIPFHDDTLGYTVTYDLYIQGKLSKRYAYSVSGRMFEWAAAPLLAPFLAGRWQVELDLAKGSEFADGLDTALWSTVRAFLADLSRDRLL